MIGTSVTKNPRILVEETVRLTAVGTFHISQFTRGAHCHMVAAKPRGFMYHAWLYRFQFGGAIIVASYCARAVLEDSYQGCEKSPLSKPRLHVFISRAFSIPLHLALPHGAMVMPRPRAFLYRTWLYRFLFRFKALSLHRAPSRSGGVFTTNGPAKNTRGNPNARNMTFGFFVCFEKFLDVGKIILHLILSYYAFFIYLAIPRKKSKISSSRRPHEGFHKSFRRGPLA